ncbi:helix-turn-helix transcriptional regulator [Massilia sp. erpn]|uniref:helix-turn-helix domain-containing protein n=1 Tax=Massilia sp. erpn TaxID=2738142 RepID=UPI0021059EFF|nr:helix-turn-helix transcriptional regulator [Massilia sp. erpn]UTY57790.1 helix-turn-helix transcriptional regulator [Massilia sp. erpn]
MYSKAFVQLAMATLSCSQRELAVRLGVSPTQISKWKSDEHMSSEMEEKFRKIINIGDRDPSFVLLAGSLEQAIKWERLIHFLADLAQENAETGYDTYPLEDEMNLLCGTTFSVLEELGVVLPKEFPAELDFDYEDNDNEELWELIDLNSYSNLIYKIYDSLNNVYGFYAAYISELIDDEKLDLFDSPAANIEPCLMSLAACKIDEDSEFTPKIKEFRYRTKEEYKEWLTIVKDRAFRAGIPLKAELLDLVYASGDTLGQDAEAESMGINSSRLHPDIYMNELLTGMRIIHQVLPAIMKKLGIDEEFKLDTSELRLP